jgi:hypothetical protein
VHLRHLTNTFASAICICKFMRVGTFRGVYSKAFSIRWVLYLELLSCTAFIEMTFILFYDILSGLASSSLFMDVRMSHLMPARKWSNIMSPLCRVVFTVHCSQCSRGNSFIVTISFCQCEARPLVSFSSDGRSSRNSATRIPS